LASTLLGVRQLQKLKERSNKSHRYAQPGPDTTGSDGVLPIERWKAGGVAAGRAAAPARNSRREPPRRWECTVCGFIYDEAAGLPDHGIAPGTAFADLPDDWTCPNCGVAKSDFEPVEGPAPVVTPAAAPDVLPRGAHPPREDLVIIGSGMAGYQLAKAVRALGVARPITVLTRDGGEFYAKPMLSNAFAQRLWPEKLAQSTPAEMAERLRMDVRPGVRVERLDAARHVVMTDAGEFSYGELVLAVGADQITLPLKGSGVSRVHQVNDLASYAAFRAALGDGGRVVIIGAGLIGCEFANDLAGAGYDVHVVELAAHPLARLVPEAIGAALAEALRKQGVKWTFGTSVETVDTAASGGLTLRLSDDTILEAGVVLSAVGLRPRLTLARQAGLTVNRGIVVDARLRTSDAGVYALGDCAEVEGKVMPFVMPLMEGARALAHTLGGDPRPVTYPVMPVVVKTPAFPLIMCPPEAAARGAWTIEGDGSDLTARFLDAENKRLLGFAVSGEAIRRRAELAAAMAGT
jgi:rubredoxin-NAD+ reductase